MPKSNFDVKYDFTCSAKRTFPDRVANAHPSHNSEERPNSSSLYFTLSSFGLRFAMMENWFAQSRLMESYKFSLGQFVEDWWSPTSQTMCQTFYRTLAHGIRIHESLDLLPALHLALCPLFYFCRERIHAHLKAVVKKDESGDFFTGIQLQSLCPFRCRKPSRL